MAVEENVKIRGRHSKETIYEDSESEEIDIPQFRGIKNKYVIVGYSVDGEFCAGIFSTIEEAVRNVIILANRNKDGLIQYAIYNPKGEIIYKS